MPTLREYISSFFCVYMRKYCSRRRYHAIVMVWLNDGVLLCVLVRLESCLRSKYFLWYHEPSGIRRAAGPLRKIPTDDECDKTANHSWSTAPSVDRMPCIEPTTGTELALSTATSMIMVDKLSCWLGLERLDVWVVEKTISDALRWLEELYFARIFPRSQSSSLPAAPSLRPTSVALKNFGRGSHCSLIC